MKRLLSRWLMFCAVLAGSDAMAGIRFTEFDLPNGLHVILQEDHTAPIVAVGLMYHVGSKNEDSARTGFAHFFEHLLFEGSDNMRRGEYLKLIQSAGGQVNANTTQDRTFYYEVVPSNDLQLVLWMESERMLHARIDSAGVETQRKVVKEEKKQRYDNTPYGQMFNVVYENAYTTYPYRWSPIGKEQYIDRASLAEFMDFYKTFYVPDNAVLVISGDIDPATAKGDVQRYFEDIPKSTRPIPRPTAPEPPQTAERRTTFYDNVQLPAVIIGYHIPKMGTEDYYAVQLLTQVLAGGKSSRLEKQLVDKQRKAVETASFDLGNEDPGLVLMLGICQQGVKPDDLESGMEAEIEKIKTEGVTDAEYSMAQNKVENDFVSQNQKDVGVAENLATYYTYFKDANLINTEIDRYKSITRKKMTLAAAKYFSKENRVVVHYLPKPSKNSRQQQVKHGK